MFVTTTQLQTTNINVDVCDNKTHWQVLRKKEKISLTFPIVINEPTRASLAIETKGLLFQWLAHLNNKSNVCKQISSLYKRFHRKHLLV